MLGQCLSSVYDAGPILIQRWVVSGDTVRDTFLTHSFTSVHSLATRGSAVPLNVHRLTLWVQGFFPRLFAWIAEGNALTNKTQISHIVLIV